MIGMWQSRPAAAPRPARHLVIDESIAVEDRGKGAHEFRLRVWMARSLPIIVLVSQVRGGPPPSWYTAKLVNRVYRVYLRFPAAPEGMLYYEADRSGTASRVNLWLMSFVSVGHVLRLTYTMPTRENRAWAEIESLAGAPVGLDG